VVTVIETLDKPDLLKRMQKLEVVATLGAKAQNASSHFGPRLTIKPNNFR
jgi:hypothetical protein